MSDRGVAITFKSFPNMNEAIQVVDHNNLEVGSATRLEMRNKNLWHRSAGVVLINSLINTYVFIHKRTAAKEYSPSHFDIPFGGIVGYGEDYLTCALRELHEESGLEIPASEMMELGSFRVDTETIAITDYKLDDLKCQESEVEYAELISLEELEKRLDTDRFTYKSRYVIELLRKFVSQNGKFTEQAN